jgi:hypothetical protein
MKRGCADSSCSVGWCGARAACAEVFTGSVDASKAKHGPGLHMRPSIYGREEVVVVVIIMNKGICICIDFPSSPKQSIV